MQLDELLSQTWLLIGAGIAVLVLLSVIAYFLLRTRPPKRPLPPPTKAPLPPRPEAAPPAERPAAVPPPEAEVVAPAAVPPPPAPVPVPEVLTEGQRVNRGLSRTKAFFQETFDRLFSRAQGQEFLGDMEEVLLSADIGIDFSEKVISELRESFGLRLPERGELKERLASILLSRLPQRGNGHLKPETPSGATAYPEGSSDARPRVVLIVGVNGAGKTTTIAKLCERYQRQGKKVLVGAADTFRAAAIDQLKTWIERVGAEGVFQKEGSDPSAVAFDTVQAAQSRGADLCLVDTAGRLHTKANLMEELKKMKRVVAKAMTGAPHDVWLVVDGSTGQNALNQAREFNEHLGLTGVIVTKLDGSSKGGAVLAIASELNVPIVFIGVGETAEDLVPFDGKGFVEAILAGL